MGKDSLSIPSISHGVSREGYMLGNIVNLKFVDHDITNEQVFMELDREKYVCSESLLGTGVMKNPCH
jgi:hypothetical protein